MWICINKNIARNAIYPKCPQVYTTSESEVKKTREFFVWNLLTVAVLFDARSYRIPNQLIILGYTAGICVNLQLHGMIGIAFFIIKALWPIATLSLLYLCGKRIGAGDIKLFSVMATMLNYKITVHVMILSVFIAGITIIALSIYEKGLIKRKLHYSFYITAAFFLLQLHT